jgi:hypothetical protein
MENQLIKAGHPLHLKALCYNRLLLLLWKFRIHLRKIILWNDCMDCNLTLNYAFGQTIIAVPES